MVVCCLLLLYVYCDLKMETWTYIEDMYLPIAPGSYRFRKGLAEPARDTKAFNLVCIRSGVKAPLLSDLSHRAKIRYGLDVVTQREALANKTPQTYIRHEDYVPPPTAETATVKNDKVMQKYFGGLGVRSAVDFKKFQPYSWTPTEAKEKGTPKAPDLLYRNTFGENSQERSNLLSPRPDVKGITSPTRLSPVLSRAESPKISKSVPASARLMRTVASRGPSRPNSKDHVMKSKEKTTLSGHHLLRSMGNTKNLELDVKPLSVKGSDQRHSLSGDNGCLFSKVQESISFVQTIERSKTVEIPRLVRPMNSERGRYRPFSKTKIETPRVLSPETAPENKNTKSVDVYMTFVTQQAARQRPTSPLQHARSYTSMGSPAMTEIINQYMTPHKGTTSPASNSVLNVSEANRPISGESTRMCVHFEKIPTWARKETDEDGGLSDNERMSRTGSRNNETNMAVHINYADKVDPLLAEDEQATVEQDEL